MCPVAGEGVSGLAGDGARGLSADGGLKVSPLVAVVSRRRPRLHPRRAPVDLGRVAASYEGRDHAQVEIDAGERRWCLFCGQSMCYVGLLRADFGPPGYQT
jgi:hypothetical protein